MLRQQRTKMLVLIALQLLWGLVLWFSISKYGLGVSTDAVHVLFGGLNLASGNGLTSYDGTFLILWPPLYPALLAVARLATGLEMLSAAMLIQVIAFLGLSLALAALFVRIFEHSFGLAVAATLLAQTGSVMFTAVGMVGSDYVHLFLVVLVLLLTSQYIESASTRTYVAMAAVCVLAGMQRYIGVAVIATAAVTMLLLAPGSLTRRFWHALILSIAALPGMVWLVITSQLYTRRDPISLAENFTWFSSSILEWFLGTGSKNGGWEPYIPGFWPLFVALFLVALLRWRSGKPAAMPPADNAASRSGAKTRLLPLFLYMVVYAIALFGSASIAYSNKLGGRFLLPLYIPLVTLPVVAADAIINRARAANSRIARILITTVCYTAVIGLATLVLRTTYPLLAESRAAGVVGGENAFNNRKWRENPAVEFWRSHAPSGDYVLLSNVPDGMAFITQHVARAAPSRRAGPYAAQAFPLSHYARNLFGEEYDVYLVWIDPNPYDHYYTPPEMKAIASMKLLFSSDQGRVFRLRPKAER